VKSCKSENHYWCPGERVAILPREFLVNAFKRFIRQVAQAGSCNVWTPAFFNTRAWSLLIMAASVTTVKFLLQFSYLV
jgi:hypothetical protein